MAVSKRIICESCKKTTWAENPPKKAPKCTKCGGQTKISSKWYVKVWVEEQNGHRHAIVKAVSSSKKVTEDYEAKLISERASGKFFDKTPRLNFKEGAEDFLDFCRQQVSEGNLGARTLEMYEGRVNANLIPYFGQTELARISKEMIEEYKKSRMLQYVTRRKPEENRHGRKALVKSPPKLISPASINRELATLKRMFNVLMDMGKIKNNPALRVKLLRENNQRDRFLEQDEIDRLLKEIQSENGRIAVLIGLNTGLRKSGCLSLEWSEIDFEKNEIVTRKTKGGKLVRIPMAKSFRTALQEWKLKSGGNIGYVLPSPSDPKTCQPRHARIGFDTACKRAKIFYSGSDPKSGIFHFHDLRHTFATHFLEANPDKIGVLAEILGHSTTYITERYAHIINRSKHKAMENFGGFSLS